MFDLHSGPWSLLVVEEASVNVGPSWMTHQGHVANLDRKDGSELRHGESKRGNEKQNIMPTSSCEQVMDTMQHNQQCQPC